MVNSALNAKTQAASLESNLVNVSSRRRRFCAYIIDKVILVLLSGTLGITASFLGAGYIMAILLYIVPLAYFILFPIHSWWATPGQRLLGIYICRSDNSKQISFVASFFRFILFKTILVVSVVLTLLLQFGSLKTATQQIPNLKNYKYQYTAQKGRYDDYIESDIFNHEEQSNADDQRDAQIYETSSKYQYSLQINRFSQQQMEMYKIFIKLTFVYLIIYSILNIGPTFFGNKKQTLYDTICNTCVMQRSK